MNLGTVTDGLIDRIGKLPSTNLRMVVTLILVIATGVVYLVLAIKAEIWGLHTTTLTQAAASAHSWTPDGTWLTFLAGMSGIDALQFGAKRMTDSSYVTAKAGSLPPQPGA